MSTVKQAFELELGDEVKLKEGEFAEVIDLAPTRLGHGVAIWIEGEEAPIEVTMKQEVVVA